METRNKSSRPSVWQITLALVVGVPGTLLLLFLCLLLAAMFLGQVRISMSLVLLLTLGLPLSAFCTLVGFGRLRDWLYILSFPVWACAVGAIALLLGDLDRGNRASLSALLALLPALGSHYLISRYYRYRRDAQTAVATPARTEAAPSPSLAPPLGTAEAPSPPAEHPRPRLSRLALLALVSAGAQWPVLLCIDSVLGITPDPMDQWIIRSRPEGYLFFAAIFWPVVTVVLSVVATSRIQRSGERLGGLALARLGVVLGIMVFLFHQTAMPGLPVISAATRSAFQRALREATTAVQQAIQYGKDKGTYPTSLKVLRDAGYGSVPDKDPWGTDYVLAPCLQAGAVPTATDEVYVYSRGRCRTGTYTPGRAARTGECAAGGFSSRDGAFSSWKQTRKP